MNEAAINKLIDCSEALIAALDGHDIAAIETALPAFADSVQHLKSAAAGEKSPALLARVTQALALTEVAKTRVRYLADRTRQRIDLLAIAAGRFDCTPATYARPR